MGTGEKHPWCQIPDCDLLGQSSCIVHCQNVDNSGGLGAEERVPILFLDFGQFRTVD